MESTNEIKDLFRPAFDAVRETIIEEGYHWDINWSSIQSKLIYLAGRYCDRFASDLNIDIFAIIRHIEQRTLQSGMHLFGFREDGVDHSSLVINRYCRQHEYSNQYGAQYRSLWRLDVEVLDGDISMKLYPVDRIIAPWRVKQAMEKETEANEENHEKTVD